MMTVAADYDKGSRGGDYYERTSKDEYGQIGYCLWTNCVLFVYYLCTVDVLFVYYCTLMKI